MADLMRRDVPHELLDRVGLVPREHAVGTVRVVVALREHGGTASQAVSSQHTSEQGQESSRCSQRVEFVAVQRCLANEGLVDLDTRGSLDRVEVDLDAHLLGDLRNSAAIELWVSALRPGSSSEPSANEVEPPLRTSRRLGMDWPEKENCNEMPVLKGMK
jgi:hypothetical protein